MRSPSLRSELRIPDAQLSRQARAYDLIGDIHGHADELIELLVHLRYREEGGAFRHADFPHRIAVFVGDFLDRGPKILETVRLVRAMLEAGTALSVLGNHEWNAFGYHLEDPETPGSHLRPHDPKNVKQHERTISQIPAEELASHLAFLRGLPIRLDLGDIRVVHACWDEEALAEIDEAYARHGGCTDALLVEAWDRNSPLFAALEIVLKGKEIDLPAGASFVDKDGHRRYAARVRWFEPPQGHHIASYTLPLFPDLQSHSALPIPEAVREAARPYPLEAPPVFFGHYWLDDESPMSLGPNVVCLDYSVAKGGYLCGYRWGSYGTDAGSGLGRTIDESRFVRLASRKPL